MFASRWNLNDFEQKSTRGKTRADDFKPLLRRELRPEGMLPISTSSRVLQQHGKVRMHHPVARRDRVVVDFNDEGLREVHQLRREPNGDFARLQFDRRPCSFPAAYR